MRVSTSQFYLQSSQLMGQKSADVNKQVAYLTEGKRVLTAKDDSVAYGTLSGYKDDLANIEKYKRNIIMAESHNNLQETIFTGVEDILHNVKDQLLQANSGAMSVDDRITIAKQTRNGLQQLLELANTQNESGDYIFSGYQIQQQPFSQQADGSVTYNGDSGVREVQVAKNINIPTNQTGDRSFIKVDNAIGDFVANYPTSPANQSGIELQSANIVDRNTYNSSIPPSGYDFTFDSVNGELTVTESGGVIVYPAAPATSAPYIAGQTISFEGIEVTLSGNPLPGDSFTMVGKQEVSIFDTINDAITWMETADPLLSPEQHQVDYNTILDQFNTAVTHITSRRVDAGVRLQSLERQEERHLDAELNVSKGLASIEDLDIAKAISEFEQSQIALQASQQAFSRVQGLTLFNYL